MAITALTSKTVGPPDNAYTWYFQSGGVSLASGITMGLGDGTETKLYLDADGIGVKSGGGFTHKLQSAATAERTASLADGGGKLWPALTAELAADATNDTVTAATVAGFDLSLEASSTYDFEMLLIFTSAGATTSPRWTINGPTAQTEYVHIEEYGFAVGAGRQLVAWGTAGNNGANPPAIGAPYAVRVRGVCKTTATTPATAVSLDIFSEIATVEIALKAGSLMRFRKIN